MKSTLASASLILAAALTLLSYSGDAAADWVLDSEHSSLSFTSVKNAAVVESHHFKKLSGGVTQQGEATLVIALDSIETMIPIRNERMRSMLFESAKFPTAKVTLNLGDHDINKLSESTGTVIDVSGTLTIKGEENKISASLLVAAIQDGGAIVSSTQPILIYASQWGLATGIDALREIVGLQSIATSVPVTLNLIFRPPTAD